MTRAPGRPDTVQVNTASAPARILKCCGLICTTTSGRGAATLVCNWYIIIYPPLLMFRSVNTSQPCKKQHLTTSSFSFCKLYHECNTMHFCYCIKSGNRENIINQVIFILLTCKLLPGFFSILSFRSKVFLMLQTYIIFSIFACNNLSLGDNGDLDGHL